MGFESFQVRLRGGWANYLEADETVRKLPHIKFDRESALMPGATYYLRDDGRHVIEIEVSGEPVRISCRFMLCHPPSVDSAFLGFVHDLMVRLGMEAEICDDVRPEHAHSFSLADYAEFSTLSSHYISARRTEWIAAFGTKQIPATTSEVYKELILPLCQPVHEQLPQTEHPQR
jgi:hypothetical protein